METWDLSHELITGIQACKDRGLLHSSKWLSELLYTLDDKNAVCIPTPKKSILDETSEVQMEDVSQDRTFILSKCYFDLKEYDRCAYFSKKLKTKKGKFLYWYSQYLSGEKKRIEDMSESEMTTENMNLQHLTELKQELSAAYKKMSLDAWSLYLYGIVLKKLRILDEAYNILLEAINLEPIHWGAWLELAGLIKSKTELMSLSVPDSWIKKFFVGHSLLEMQRNEEALDIYDSLKAEGFSKSIYIAAQIAMAYHNMRDTDSAMVAFDEVVEADPMRLESMDVYSNVLYVREMRVQLADLAHRANSIDKYKPETCCIIGNYYGLRQQHEKAVLYFRRALKLNPGYLAAWTLMGHEYLEIKNTNAAIQCYRNALEISTQDYRAWYGLGQTYEVLKLYHYSLHYYRQAAVLRPNDSRMVVALGDIYEKLELYDEAAKCYWKARCLGDIEAIALHNLARLYEKQKDKEKAANAYQAYLKLLDSGAEDQKPSVQQLEAELFLARYSLDKGSLEEAFTYAQKCCAYPECRESAKAILKEITQERAKLSDSIRMDESLEITTSD